MKKSIVYCSICGQKFEATYTDTKSNDHVCEYCLTDDYVKMHQKMEQLLKKQQQN